MFAHVISLHESRIHEYHRTIIGYISFEVAGSMVDKAATFSDRCRSLYINIIIIIILRMFLFPDAIYFHIAPDMNLIIIRGQFTLLLN